MPHWRGEGRQSSPRATGFTIASARQVRRQPVSRSRRRPFGLTDADSKPGIANPLHRPRAVDRRRRLAVRALAAHGHLAGDARQTYGHLLPDALDRARSALDTFVARPAESVGGD
jgi:hypothetical protein